MLIPRRIRYSLSQVRRSNRRKRRTLRFVEPLEPRFLLAASLAGRVFEDLNGNQRWEPNAPQNEPALECFDVFLDLNRDGVRGPGEPSTRTGVDGTYRFEDVAAGEYAVDLVADS